MNKRIVEPAQRRIEIGVAVLFLLTAATSITGEVLLAPLLTSRDFLAGILSHRFELVTSAVLWSINNIGIVFIAVFLFPLLEVKSRFVAVGYLVTRIIEGTLMMVGILALLLLVPLSESLAKAGVPSDSWYAGLGEILKAAKVLGITNLSLPLLGLGGCLLSWQLVQHRLVPAVIAWTGVVGYLLVLVGGVVGWYGVLDVTPGGPSTFMAIPVALFEIILLPFWLLFKGFQLPSPQSGVSS